MWGSTIIPHMVCATYKTHYICKPGAAIKDLKTDALELLSELPSDNTVLFIKIAAGIVNLTNKIKHNRCYEVAPSRTTAEAVKEELLDLKNAIKLVRPDSFVTFVTITPCVFLKQLEYF